MYLQLCSLSREGCYRQVLAIIQTCIHWLKQIGLVLHDFFPLLLLLHKSTSANIKYLFLWFQTSAAINNKHLFFDKYLTLYIFCIPRSPYYCLSCFICSCYEAYEVPMIMINYSCSIYSFNNYSEYPLTWFVLFFYPFE